MARDITAVTMPKWGSEMTEGTIRQWTVAQGARVAKGMPLVDVETEKIINSAEAAADGVLRRILAGSGAVRPVGALIFGLLADRYGRRLPLMIDLVFYSVAEVATGFAGNYTTFLVLRAIFGIGMGGEWGVGASLVMEKVPAERRGMFSGLLQQGYAAGYLLAALCYFFVFPRWGWRPLFFIGGLPALLALYIRMQVTESEVWQRTKAESWRHLGKAIAENWKTFVYITLLMAMMNGVSHGTQDLYRSI